MSLSSGRDGSSNSADPVKGLPILRGSSNYETWAFVLGSYMRGLGLAPVVGIPTEQNYIESRSSTSSIQIVKKEGESEKDTLPQLEEESSSSVSGETIATEYEKKALEIIKTQEGATQNAKAVSIIVRSIDST